MLKKISLSRRAGAQPLTTQIAKSLTKQIKSGSIKQGENLPSERTLANQVGVARNIVRNAYVRLEGNGLIKNHGRDGRTVAKSMKKK